MMTIIKAENTVELEAKELPQFDIPKKEKKTTGLTLGKAIKRMKQGCSVARAGWNGKGMFIYYVPGGDYTTQTDIAKMYFGDTAHYQPYIAMKTADGTVVPWLASQTDLLAEDYEVVHNG